MIQLWQDIWYAVRLFRRRPGWSTAVVFMLAIGIGANAVAFALTYAALLRTLPFPNADRLVWVSANGAQPNSVGEPAVSAGQLRQWQTDLQRVFSSVGAVTAGSADNIWRINGLATAPFTRSVSATFFGVLGAKAELGRLLTAADARVDHGRVAVISDDFWRREFGGNPHVIGAQIEERLNTYGKYTVVGVLQPEFRLDQPTDIWVPDVPSPSTANSRNLFLIGRLRTDSTLTAAREVTSELERRYPAPSRATVLWPAGMPWSPQVTPLRSVFGKSLRSSLFLLQLASVFLLLLACANVASLLLGRAHHRQNELAIRAALGGSQARLRRQLLTESAVLASLGALFGYSLAAIVLNLLYVRNIALLPPRLLSHIAALHVTVLSFPVLLWTGGTAILSVLLFGVLPSWKATSVALRNPRTSSAHFRWLVAGEAMLAALLVCSAGLLIHSFANLDRVDPGFQMTGRIAVKIEMPLARDCTPRPDCVNSQRQHSNAYLLAVLNRLRGLPAVAAAAAATTAPLSDDNSPALSAPPRAMSVIFPTLVTPGYFSLMGVRLIAGRDFDNDDTTAQTKKVIVNESFARRYFPSRSPLEERLALARCGTNNPDPMGCTVIGVVGDMRDQSLAAAPQPQIFESVYQDQVPGLTLILKSREPALTLPALTALLRGLPSVDGQQPYVFPPRNMNVSALPSIANHRFWAWFAALLAGLALLMAAFGVFCVQSYAVERRAGEIGLRMALGASSSKILSNIVCEAVLWSGTGTALGLLASLAANRLLASMLFGVGSFDPLVVAATPAVLLGAVLAAVAVPAWRATRIDPARVLRREA
ncbi:MAG: ADOP family duplicated permease [Gammaproteobacteria bacterium]